MRADGRGQFNDGLPRAPEFRAKAFADAARHSARVKTLRQAMIGGAGLACFVLFAWTFLKPSGTPGAHLSLEKLGLSGDKVTMEHPKMTGVRRDGRPYEVTAEAGVQHPREPNRMELSKLDAKMRLSDDGETRITGDAGIYDSGAQSLDLAGNVHIISAGYDLAMQNAKMDFKTNAMFSQKPVQLTFKDGWVHADSMNMADNGAQITFIGNVQSQFNQAAESADAAEPPAK